MTRRLVNEIAGEESVSLLNILEERENVSEFELAEILKLNVNKVRNLLYKLYSYNLVYSSRKKDSQKGWYIYYWTFNFKHAKDLLVLLKERRRKELKEELERETKTTFYVCENGCKRVPLEEAMSYNFKCQECEARLIQEDSSNKIQEIHAELHRLNEELEELKKPVIIMPKKEIKPIKLKKEEAIEKIEVKKQKKRKKLEKVKEKEAAKKKHGRKKVVKTKKPVKRKVVRKIKPKRKAKQKPRRKVIKKTKPKHRQIKKPVKKTLLGKIRKRIRKFK